MPRKTCQGKRAKENPPRPEPGGRDEAQRLIGRRPQRRNTTRRAGDSQQQSGNRARKTPRSFRKAAGGLRRIASAAASTGEDVRRGDGISGADVPSGDWPFGSASAEKTFAVAHEDLLTFASALRDEIRRAVGRQPCVGHRRSCRQNRSLDRDRRCRSTARHSCTARTPCPVGRSGQNPSHGTIRGGVAGGAAKNTRHGVNRAGVKAAAPGSREA